MYLVSSQQENTMLFVPPAGLFHELGYVMIHVHVSSIYIHIYIYTYIHTYLHVYLYTCIYIHRYIRMYIYIYIYIHRYVYIYIYTYIDMYVYIYIYTYIYLQFAYTHIRICVYMHTYIATQQPSGSSSADRGGMVGATANGVTGRTGIANENIMGWGCMKSIISWRYDGISYDNIHTYIYIYI